MFKLGKLLNILSVLLSKVLKLRLSDLNLGKWIKLLDKSGKIINKNVKKLDNYLFNQGSLV